MGCQIAGRMQSTLKNRTIFCRDNLEVLRGIDSNTVDLVYLDPPFNKKREFTAPIGSSAEGASFQDIFREADVKEEWIGLIADRAPVLHAYLQGIGDVGHRSNKYYLCYMAVRLLELHRVLKETGSLYLHCDPTMSHYLKLLLDVIFGEKNFINEIIWHYGTPSGGRAGGKKPVKVHDTLLVYGINYGSHLYNRQYTDYSQDYVEKWFRHTDDTGKKYQTRSRAGKIIRQYLDESKGVPLSSVWAIKQLYGQKGWFPSKLDEAVGYPTQKPLALLERIIAASSNEGDLVLDPFCGCATTCVAAERLSRQWIGIDVSKKAYELVQKRLNDQQKAIGGDLFQEKIVYREDIPARTDVSATKTSVKEVKHELYGRQEGRCTGCKVLFEYRNLTIDHIVPQAKGGGSNTENLQLLCGSCNSIKGKRDMSFLGARLKELGIGQL